MADTESNKNVTRCVLDLPEEILEYILSLVSQYRDLKTAMLVCKYWYRIVKGVIKTKIQSFHQALEDRHIYWEYTPPEPGPRITERYFHSACYVDKCMYVFGGCTPSSTAFNDLWKFDLATRRWSRPLALGTYPAPKACASMVVYNENLVLFGGWSNPTPYPLHQAAHFFNQLHIFSHNRWYQINPEISPPPTAGHSASVIGDNMIVFGGSHGYSSSSNDIWVLDLIEMSWQQQVTTNTRPHPRYGHSQVVIDDKHILILGGSGGPNLQFSDIWLLSMTREPWRWCEVKGLNPEYSPQQLLCHPACKVEDKIVVVSKPSKSVSSQLKTTDSSDSQHRHFPRNIPDQRHRSHQRSAMRSRLGEGSNEGQRSAFDDDPDIRNVSRTLDRMRAKRQLDSSESSGDDTDPDIALHRPVSGPLRASGLRSYTGGATARVGMPSIRPNAMNDRQKQLETLQRYAHQIRTKAAEKSKSNSTATSRPMRETVNYAQIHVLDIKNILMTGCVSWLSVQDNFNDCTPEETIFYSLIEGRGELIMFGGIRADLNSMQRGVNMSSHQINGGVYFISAPKLTVM